MHINIKIDFFIIEAKCECMCLRMRHIYKADQKLNKYKNAFALNKNVGDKRIFHWYQIHQGGIVRIQVNILVAN